MRRRQRCRIHGIACETLCLRPTQWLPLFGRLQLPADEQPYGLIAEPSWITARRVSSRWRGRRHGSLERSQAVSSLLGCGRPACRRRSSCRSMPRSRLPAIAGPRQTTHSSGSVVRRVASCICPRTGWIHSKPPPFSGPSVRPTMVFDDIMRATLGGCDRPQHVGWKQAARRP